MNNLNDIISEYMAKRGVKDEHFITPQQWKDIALIFAKEVAKEQRVICAGNADYDYDHTDPYHPTPKVDKESILNAKSPV